jgi:non-homologous end joining protein Ku
VACPVSLWSATTTAETLRFNLINPKTNNRVRMKTVDAGTGEELSRGDLVKGFAVIREAMKRKGMVAIGRLVMSTPDDAAHRRRGAHPGRDRPSRPA